MEHTTNSAPMSKKQLAYERIKSMLVNGELKPQESLVERQLCQKLGVSRTPVRQALQALVSDGFLEIIEGKGVFLRKVNLRDLVELFELRLALESLAMYLFVERATSDTIAHLHQIHDAAGNALAEMDHEKFMDHDMQFHSYIALESKNSRLRETIESNYDLIRMMAISARDDSELCQLAFDNHSAILEAVERRDKMAAANCIADHITQIKQYHQNRFYLYE